MMRRALLVLLLLVGSAAGAVAAAPAASALGIDLPGIDICSEVEASPPTGPTGGMAGNWATPPLVTTDNVADPERLYSSGGYGGFWVDAYTANCVDWEQRTDTHWANNIGGFALAITAVADGIERRAWSPDWITDALGNFASIGVRDVGAWITVAVLVVGLAYLTLALLANEARRQDTSGVLEAVSWAVIVSVITMLVLTFPLGASLLVRQGSEVATRTLYQSDLDPATITTDRTLYAIHYQGWLRKTFCDSNAQSAAEFGPTLIETRRLSWAENELPPAERAAVIEAKSERFEQVAEQIKEVDEAAYRCLTGETADRVNQGFVEQVYAFTAASIRIVTAVLMIVAMLSIFGVGIIWLFVGGYIATRHGVELGTGLLDAAARAVGYGLMGVAANYAWSVWILICLGIDNAGWGMLLALLGAALFFSVLRPDRKILSLVSGGRIKGNGKAVKKLLGKGFDKYINYTATRKGTEHGVEATQAAEAKVADSVPVAPIPPPRPEPVVIEPTSVRLSEERFGAPRDKVTGPTIVESEVYRRPEPAVIRGEIGSASVPSDPYGRPSDLPPPQPRGATWSVDDEDLYTRPTGPSVAEDDRTSRRMW